MASASLLTVFAVFQAPPNVEPPWRNDRALVRRDSLNIRWTIPHSEPPVLYVEWEHDGGFGGNFTTTLAIRRWDAMGMGTHGTRNAKL